MSTMLPVIYSLSSTMTGYTLMYTTEFKLHRHPVTHTRRLSGTRTSLAVPGTLQRARCSQVQAKGVAQAQCSRFTIMELFAILAINSVAFI